MPSRKGWTEQEYNAYSKKQDCYLVLREFMPAPGVLLEVETEFYYNPDLEITAFIGRTLDDDNILQLSKEHVNDLVEGGYLLKLKQ